MGLFAKGRGQKSLALPRPLDPVNALEERLRDAVWDPGEIEAFVGELVRSQVFLLSQGDPAESPPAQLRPLVQAGSEGHPCLCVFTHPDRALPIQADHPDYRLGLLVAFTWILETAPKGLGLLINPGWDLTTEQPPHGLDQLRQDYASGRWSASA